MLSQEIYIIDDQANLISTLKELFYTDKEYRFTNVHSNEVGEALKNIPNLIIIHEDNIYQDALDICKVVRSDEDNTITPIIVISSNKEHDHRIQILQLGVSHYIVAPINQEFLYYTIKNIIKLMYVNRRVSPLTGLPGNVQIQAEMKKRWFSKETFAMMYIDLDNFKAYNDVYGFLKGDHKIHSQNYPKKCTYRTVRR